MWEGFMESLPLQSSKLAKLSTNIIIGWLANMSLAMAKRF